MTVSIDALDVADPADAWARAGFTVHPGEDAEPVCHVGRVRMRLLGRDRGAGLLGWSLRGLPPDRTFGDLDGIPTAASHTAAAPPATHANGVTAIDHVVLLAPDLGRTVGSLETIGVRPRRERDVDLGQEPFRQVFFRFGEVIVEVIGSRLRVDDGPTTLWGITFVAADIDATAAFFGHSATPVKDAVQPGRRITTLRHDTLGMSVRTAVISPPILGA